MEDENKELLIAQEIESYNEYKITIEKVRTLMREKKIDINAFMEYHDKMKALNPEHAQMVRQNLKKITLITLIIAGTIGLIIIIKDMATPEYKKNNYESKIDYTQAQENKFINAEQYYAAQEKGFTNATEWEEAQKYNVNSPQKLHAYKQNLQIWQKYKQYIGLDFDTFYNEQKEKGINFYRPQGITSAIFNYAYAKENNVAVVSNKKTNEIMAFGFSDGNGTYFNKFIEDRKQELESNFSMWDGSHRKLTQLVKNAMNNPKSFEHVKTIYYDHIDTLTIVMQYRGTNAFGAIVTNDITATVDAQTGEVLDILFIFLPYL